jgi:hypothetical protein
MKHNSWQVVYYRPIFLITLLKAGDEEGYSLSVGFFVSGERSPASGSDLGRSMPGQSSIKYDSVYPIFRTAAQARSGLGAASCQIARGFHQAFCGEDQWASADRARK